MFCTRSWAAAFCAAALGTTALAQPAPFPTQTVRIVLPFAAGGATDVIARTTAQKLGEKWGQPVVVDNKAGGNGNIGAALVARAAPDGYTLLMATSSHAINASLYKKLDYGLQRDFIALSNIAAVPLVLVATPGLPVTSARQLASLAAASGGQALNFGSGGVGTAAHLAGEMFNAGTGARMVHVAYKGGAPAMNDLLGGQIQIMFANLPEALAHVRAGKLKALGVTGSTRHPQLPDVPTLQEAGFADMQLKSWFGLFAPKGTPQAVVDKLSADLAAVVADPAVQARLRDLGGEPIGNRHEEFQAFLGQDIDRWGALVKRSGATAE